MRRWLLVIVILVAISVWPAWKAWVDSAHVSDLRIEGGWGAPQSEHALVFGKARWRDDEKLIVLNNDGPVVDHAPRVPSRPVFSRDGKHAAWLRADRTIALCDLSSGNVRSIGHLDQPASGLALSPSGSSVAVYIARRVELYDVVGAAKRWAVPLPWSGSTDPLFFFASEDRLLFYPPQRGEARAGKPPIIHSVLALNVRTRTFEEVARFTSDFPGLFVRPDATGEFFLTLEHQRTVVQVNHKPIATDGMKLRSAAFLGDGSVAVVLRGEKGSVVRRGRCTIPLAELPAEAWIRESGTGHVLVDVAARERGAWHLYDVNLDRCISRSVAIGLAPLDPLEFWFAPALPRGSQDWSSARWFIDEQQRLRRVTP